MAIAIPAPQSRLSSRNLTRLAGFRSADGIDALMVLLLAVIYFLLPAIRSKVSRISLNPSRPRLVPGLGNWRLQMYIHCCIYIPEANYGHRSRI
jgi:hypothetical protein